jgi:hypothetical protein
MQYDDLVGAERLAGQRHLVVTAELAPRPHGQGDRELGAAIHCASVEESGTVQAKGGPAGHRTTGR